MVASALVALPAAAVAPDTPVFINELHYDNASTDVNEFVEVAGPAGTDLTGWSVVLYNGNGGAAYGTLPLSGALGDDTGSGFGFRSVAAVGLQNGAPDGVALVDGSGALVQFLSYEGVFAATSGAATGQTSTDIGVIEGGSGPVGESLQLTGTGDSYGDFTWAASAAETPGAANNDQVFVASGDPLPPALSCEAALEVTAGEAGSSTVSASDADSGIDSLAITSAVVDGITLEGSTAPTGVGEAATATLTVADTTAAGIYEVQITATSDDDAQALCTVTVTVSAPLATSLVSDVQGSGSASPLVDQEVQVEAVVTSLITSRDVLDGFFVQEEDADADADPATSEGVYVFCRSACPTGLAAGDLVTVVGTVEEDFTSTRVNATGGSVDVVASGQPLPTAAVVTLPASTSTRDAATFEAVEGMITTVSTTLVVSEYFNLARFGEIVLTADERGYQYTQTNTPSVEGYQAFQAELAKHRIVLDDDSNDQNDATSGPLNNEPYYYPTPGLSTENYFRGGDTITGLTGVMEYSFGAWKLRPVPGVDYTFESVNPRPATPDDVGGRLQVASFNVLNYFATVDTTSSDDTGTCGPTGTDDCRGADSELERERQLAKIVAALKTIDADVFGLIEIQNDEGAATQQIVDALNAATAPGTYAYIETGTIGTDAIKQAFLYKPATVTPVGDFALLTEEDDARFDTDRNRPALIQTFDEVATGERFTVAVNHLKSKGSGCGAGDDSPQDGSGNCDLTRTQAAAALADYLATDPTGSGDPDFLVIGDLNSYSMERPISTLEAAGYVDLLETYEGLESYGYLFDGLLGHLDHALATESLAAQVTGAGGWKVNADEVPLFDYNDTVRDTGEASFERESSALPLYEPTPYRSSDHDPVVVGLSLASNEAPVANAGGPYVVKPGARVVLDASKSVDADGDELTFAWDLDGDGAFDDATGPTATFHANRPPGIYPVAVQVSDGTETSTAATIVEVVPPGLMPRL
ncbi:ExeM/NucH family extracellular endonuclease [Actinotalea sp. Marseille-Q4924]|uniref:ExeM/NucH family extracellular endonuclease n=1 Tax=Actinotalea sp. Marseille-Q4924 TaxID=2866571 RepID=UPI001CE46929|nr:ExeM/NucH family extracellular endonuclease [Actinotalea sp. Marseille-Q4924]